MSDKRYYVYELIDPRNKLPFYVGKGRGNRMYSHVAEAKRDRGQWSNVLKCDRIRKIIENNLVVQYNVPQNNLCEEDAFNLENALIKKYGLLINNTGYLTNIRINEQFHSTIPQRHTQRRVVIQYTMDGCVVQKFSSVTSAADHFKKHKTGILNCCNGKRYAAYGFVWKYANEKFVSPPTEIPYHVKRRKPIAQYTQENELICVYKSVKHAAEVTNIKAYNIRSCLLDKKQYTAGGYLWKYINKPTVTYNY